jgi:TPR repeat protein
MNQLGENYKFGMGVDKSMTDAIAWYRKAVKLSFPPAMYNLSNALREKREDDPEANNLMKQAADAGMPLANFELSTALREGKWGLAQNISEAMKRLNVAAEGGEPMAMADLAILYSVGGYVSKDPAMAAVWENRAALTQDKAALARIGHYKASVQRTRR